MKTREEMLKMLDVLVNESLDYQERLNAYEYLSEDCSEILDEMLAKFYTLDGDTAAMLLEVMAEYKGNKGVYMGLVSYLYKGEDIAQYARLLGKYGDPAAIDILKSFAEENDLNYNEFMEIRNAVEELGGYFEQDEKAFENDEFYRYIKGLDEPEEDSRRSPFEDVFADKKSEAEEDEEEQ